MIGAAIISSAISKCASHGERLVFTKDWVVVLANIKNKNKKTKDDGNENNAVIENERVKRNDGQNTELSRSQLFGIVIVSFKSQKLFYRLNSTIVSIDQGACVVSPLILGILLDYFGSKPICIAISVLSIISLFAGRHLLSSVYHSVPELANREALPAENPTKTEGINSKYNSFANVGVKIDFSLVI